MFARMLVALTVLTPWMAVQGVGSCGRCPKERCERDGQPRYVQMAQRDEEKEKRNEPQAELWVREDEKENKEENSSTSMWVGKDDESKEDSKQSTESIIC